jgi:hypothetical protein
MMASNAVIIKLIRKRRREAKGKLIINFPAGTTSARR